MGWLGGDTAVTVATSVTRVIKDSLLPNAVRSGTFEAILKDENIPETVVEAVSESMGVRADRMHDYALASYPYGRPDAHLITGAFARDEINARLELIEGAPVTIDYSHLGAPNALHTAWLRLVSDWGYNPATNELTVLSTAKGKPVYLQDLQVMVPESQLSTLPANTLELWGRAAAAGPTPFRSYTEAEANALAPTPVFFGPDVTTLHVQMTATWNDAASPAPPHQATETHDISVDGPDLTEDYAHVKYTVGSTIKYWTYLIGSGTYPEIDAVFYSGSEMGSFFPMAYFRFNHVDQSLDTTTPEYRASKRLVKYLGMDYAAVAESINGNPDINNVEQAILVMAVPANTDVPVELRYLFDFYSALYEVTPTEDRVPPPDGVGAGGWELLSLFVPMSKGLVVIQDQRFRMSLSNTGLYKYRVTGVIGPEGSYSRGAGTANTVVTQTINADGATEDLVVSHPVHLYRHQVSATEYDEVAVVDMKLRYYIFGKYGVTASDTEDILLVPLDRAITSQYSLKVREQLYARSLHFVFNAVVYTHVAWYQSFEFQFAMVVAAVVISLGNPELTALATLAEAGATDLALLLLEDLVLNFAASYAAVRLLAKVVGPQAALLLAIAAMAAGAFSSTTGVQIPMLPDVKTLLSLASNLGKIALQGIQNRFKELSQEYQQFNSQVAQANEVLENAKQLLEQDNRLSPFVIFGEKPEEFFTRTVHSGNIGMLGISAISSYVDTALMLPTLDKTLGGNFYG